MRSSESPCQRDLSRCRVRHGASTTHDAVAYGQLCPSPVDIDAAVRYVLSVSSSDRFLPATWTRLAANRHPRSQPATSLTSGAVRGSRKAVI